jgi:hypothetical protein
LVRPERLELSQARPTRPSTVPVYQFQHGRIIIFVILININVTIIQ